MKTYRNLYPQICAWKNLESAYRKARRGKRKNRSSGPHRHVSQMVDEVGRLLGGWFKALGRHEKPQAVEGLPQ